MLCHIYANYFVQKILGFLKINLRQSLLEEAISGLSYFKCSSNPTYLYALRSIFQSKLTLSDQWVVLSSISKYIKEMVQRPKSSVILETIVCLFDKTVLKGIEQQIISQATKLIKKKCGMHLVEKIILTNSYGTYEEFTEIFKSVCKDMSQEDAKCHYKRLQKHFDSQQAHSILKSLISEVTSQFFEFIELKNGTYLISTLIDKFESFSSGTKLMNALIAGIPDDGLLDSINGKNYKLIEYLINYPAFAEKVFEISKLRPNEIERRNLIKKSNIYHLCSSSRGVNVLELLLIVLEKNKKTKLHNDLSLMYKEIGNYINISHKSRIEDLIKHYKNEEAKQEKNRRKETIKEALEESSESSLSEMSDEDYDDTNELILNKCRRSNPTDSGSIQGKLNFLSQGVKRTSHETVVNTKFNEKKAKDSLKTSSSEPQTKSLCNNLIKNKKNFHSKKQDKTIKNNNNKNEFEISNIKKEPVEVETIETKKRQKENSNSNINFVYKEPSKYVNSSSNVNINPNYNNINFINNKIDSTNNINNNKREELIPLNNILINTPQYQNINMSYNQFYSPNYLVQSPGLTQNRVITNPIYNGNMNMVQPNLYNMYSQMPGTIQYHSQQTLPLVYSQPIQYGYGIQNFNSPMIQNFYQYPQVPTVVNSNFTVKNPGLNVPIGETKEGDLIPKVFKTPSYNSIQEPLRVPFDLLNSCKNSKESKLLNEITSIKISRESKQSSSVSSN